jgi:hypothetical protein
MIGARGEGIGWQKQGVGATAAEFCAYSLHLGILSKANDPGAGCHLSGVGVKDL